MNCPCFVYLKMSLCVSNVYLILYPKVAKMIHGVLSINTFISFFVKFSGPLSLTL